MRGLLLRCYDAAYDHIGKLSWTSARNFAWATELGFLESRCQSLGPQPYLYKLTEIHRHLVQDDLDFVVYADVDILFNPSYSHQSCVELPRKFFENPLMCSTDSCGVCCGFMVVQKHPDVIKLLDIWAKLGYTNKKGRNTGDQDTLKLLSQNFNWVYRIIGQIPHDLISSPDPMMPPVRGKVGHHFWANGGESWWSSMATDELRLWAAPQPKPEAAAPALA